LKLTTLDPAFNPVRKVGSHIQATMYVARLDGLN
jgi:hypothetical protein